MPAMVKAWSNPNLNHTSDQMDLEHACNHDRHSHEDLQLKIGTTQTQQHHMPFLIIIHGDRL